MKALCLILLFHASLQLQCDKSEITAHTGGEFIIICKYDTNRYLFSKKYWCRGDSRNICQILVDSERVDKTGYRSRLIDAGRRGLFVKITDLQFADSGKYWIGIDKIYADIMTSVNVFITEVPVSKPRLWPLSSLMDRQTCWGQPVTVRCGCATGTGISFAWYQHTHHKDFLFQQSSDLGLHCDTVENDSDYYCIARNDISSQRSDFLSVQVLMPANNSCIYVVNMQGQPIYDCADRISTTTAHATMKTYPHTTNHSVQTNRTDQDLFFSSAWTRMPLWYTLLRWCCFASILMFLWIVLRCTKVMSKKHAKRKRKKRKAGF